MFTVHVWLCPDLDADREGSVPSVPDPEESCSSGGGSLGCPG